MLSCQRHEFSIPLDIHYFNCASQGPLSKKVASIGQQAVNKKSQPYTISRKDYFDPVHKMSHTFAQLIGSDEVERVVPMSSVSYGMSSLAQNVCLSPGDEIILMAEQFPSNVYPWIRAAQRSGAIIRTINSDANDGQKVASWNRKILEAITDKTAVVAMAPVHWADGSKFDLKAIREKTIKHHALMILDGTQSIGALPFDIKEIPVDALICAAYKWLLGPYGTTLAWIGEYFDKGQPLEENWINRKNAEQFEKLVDYQELYKPKAGRYAVGQQSNFINTPMVTASIQQILDWGVEHIQDYCDRLTTDLFLELESLGCVVNDKVHRSPHLFGIGLTKGMNKGRLLQYFEDHQVIVSMRSDTIRIGVNVFNNAQDIDFLIEGFKLA